MAVCQNPNPAKCPYFMLVSEMVIKAVMLLYLALLICLTVYKYKVSGFILHMLVAL